MMINTYQKFPAGLCLSGNSNTIYIEIGVHSLVMSCLVSFGVFSWSNLLLLLLNIVQSFPTCKIWGVMIFCFFENKYQLRIN